MGWLFGKKTKQGREISIGYTERRQGSWLPLTGRKNESAGSRYQTLHRALLVVTECSSSGPLFPYTVRSAI